MEHAMELCSMEPAVLHCPQKKFFHNSTIQCKPGSTKQQLREVTRAEDRASGSRRFCMDSSRQKGS